MSHRSRPLGRFAAFVFDMDGVVTDTAGLHAEAWMSACDAHLPSLSAHAGVPEVPFDMRSDYEERLDGRGRFDGARLVLAARGITIPEGSASDAPGLRTVCGFANAAAARFAALLAERGAARYPATLDLCERLAACDVALGLVTSSRSCRAVLASAGLEHRFDTVVDAVLLADLGLPGKPAPAPFLEAADRLEVGPAACAAVDDGATGVAAARAAGFGLVVGLERSGTAARRERLGRLADVVVAEVDELVVRAA